MRFMPPALSKVLSLGLVLSAAMLTTACAHQDEKKLDAAIAATPNIENSQALREEVMAKIEKDPDLSPEQRKQFIDLRKSLKTELDAIHEERLKLQALLMDAVLEAKYNPAKIGTIKKRMKETEDKQLSRIFQSVDKANQILGRSSTVEHRREIMNDLMQRPASGSF
jgi:hypothetical protein